MNSKDRLIIGITGKKGHGKDTIGDWLVNNKKCIKYSFAEPLKEACKIIFNLTDKQVYGSQEDKETIDERYGISSRKILQLVGTELFRVEWPKISGLKTNIWEENMKNKIKNTDDNIVITDVRFDNEAKLIKEMGGVVIKVVADLETRRNKKIKSLLEEKKILQKQYNETTDIYNRMKFFKKDITDNEPCFINMNSFKKFNNTFLLTEELLNHLDKELEKNRIEISSNNKIDQIHIGHSSEIDIDMKNVDYVIYNDDTIEQLYGKVQELNIFK